MMNANCKNTPIRRAINQKGPKDFLDEEVYPEDNPLPPLSIEEVDALVRNILMDDKEWEDHLAKENKYVDWDTDNDFDTEEYIDGR